LNQKSLAQYAEALIKESTERAANPGYYMYDAHGYKIFMKRLSAQVIGYQNAQHQPAGLFAATLSPEEFKDFHGRMAAEYKQYNDAMNSRGGSKRRRRTRRR